MNMQENKHIVNRRLYDCWRNMMRRCYAKKNKSYGIYGLLGITVCDEWHNQQTFMRWALQSDYKDHLTIERIDNNGNYEPSNCTWIPKSLQVRNSKKAKITEQIAEEIRIRYAAGGITTYELAEDYPITASTVQRIIKGEYWKPILSNLEQP